MIIMPCVGILRSVCPCDWVANAEALEPSEMRLNYVSREATTDRHYDTVHPSAVRRQRRLTVSHPSFFTK